MIGNLLIEVAIAGGATTLTKKNLLLGVIGATIPLGTSVYVTLSDVVTLANMPSGIMEPSNALSDIVTYFVWPIILVFSILSLIFLVKSKASSSRAGHHDPTLLRARQMSSVQA